MTTKDHLMELTRAELILHALNAHAHHSSATAVWEERFGLQKREICRLEAENAELVKILREIGNANEAQVAPVYSELAREALAKVKESGK
jgi:hypothetical protein